MADVSLKVPVEEFNRLADAINKQVKVPLRDIIRGEAGAICKFCLAKAPIYKGGKSKDDPLYAKTFAKLASKNVVTVNRKNTSKAERGTVWFSPQGESGNAKSGRKIIFVGVTEYGKFTNLRNAHRLSNAHWFEFKQLFKSVKEEYAKLKRGRAESIGLTKASWLHVLKSLGFNDSEINKLPYKAVPKKIYKDYKNSNGRTLNFGFSFEINSGQKYSLRIINTSFIAAKSDKGTLNRAISSRRAGFKNNIKHGVFNSLETLKSRYPYITFK